MLRFSNPVWFWFIFQERSVPFFFFLKHRIVFPTHWLITSCLCQFNSCLVHKDHLILTRCIYTKAFVNKYPSNPDVFFKVHKGLPHTESHLMLLTDSEADIARTCILNITKFNLCAAEQPVQKCTIKFLQFCILGKYFYPFYLLTPFAYLSFPIPTTSDTTNLFYL